ncbi:MAG: putative nitrogen fixation protein NifT [Rhodospirillales bacterium]|nr:putative nitrogen fixation protein NifT [Rhodospirillales bacterium]
MKVTIGRSGDGYSAYVPKKDLEEAIVAMELPHLWGGWIDLANGWRLALPEMEAESRLPITVNAKRLSTGAP